MPRGRRRFALLVLPALVVVSGCGGPPSPAPGAPAPEPPPAGPRVLWERVIQTTTGSRPRVFGCAADALNRIYLVGETTASDYPTTEGAYDRSCGTDGRCNGDPSRFISPRSDVFVTAFDERARSPIRPTSAAAATTRGAPSRSVRRDERTLPVNRGRRTSRCRPAPRDAARRPTSARAATPSCCGSAPTARLWTNPRASAAPRSTSAKPLDWARTDRRTWPGSPPRPTFRSCVRCSRSRATAAMSSS